MDAPGRQPPRGRSARREHPVSALSRSTQGLKQPLCASDGGPGSVPRRCRRAQCRPTASSPGRPERSPYRRPAIVGSFAPSTADARARRGVGRCSGGVPRVGGPTEAWRLWSPCPVASALGPIVGRRQVCGVPDSGGPTEERPSHRKLNGCWAVGRRSGGQAPDRWRQEGRKPAKRSSSWSGAGTRVERRTNVSVPKMTSWISSGRLSRKMLSPWLACTCRAFRLRPA